MGRMNDFEAPTTVLYIEESGCHDERLVFTASGAEYFRIWIVNLLLTVATLGIYSAWAKVRRLRYFYGSTRLARCGFDYHGSPGAILRGRIVALLFFGAYNISWSVSSSAAVLMLGVIAALMPWLIWKSLQFKLYNSSYRGIRFGCGGRPGRVYFVYLLLPLLSLCTLHLLTPFTHQRIKKFQHEESRYGATYFSFHAGPAGFYKAYALGSVAAVAGALLIALAFSGMFSDISDAGGLKQAGGATQGTFLLFIAANYLWLQLLITICSTQIQNLIWNKTRLGGHQFRCDLKPWKTAWITLSNLAGVLLTLGLFLPFAQVRMLKYRIEAITFIPAGSLDGFIETTQGIVSAAGEGASDMLDFDLSL
ncbi:YjgN family protein [Noviherbaspirillum aridicola]|uniref:Membrane protein n=1 Tax=Noviherbaspirillum aridicola TaxID=2849687 RepID=A0ABQ4Q3F3_9BURK|nr:YjgN family protein [Noviherbaspirillum aridicola]GIZ51551.1 membrane protein [Noviherbaspirillum aridicola]